MVYSGVGLPWLTFRPSSRRVFGRDVRGTRGRTTEVLRLPVGETEHSVGQTPHTVSSASRASVSGMKYGRGILTFTEGYGWSSVSSFCREGAWGVAGGRWALSSANPGEE